MGACGVYMCGVGECVEGGGGSIVAKFYLRKKVLKKFGIRLLQIFLSMRYTVL